MTNNDIVVPKGLNRDHWTLRQNLTFLNHGSFGACPKVVLKAQTEWRRRIEEQPIVFFTYTYQQALDEARAKLAPFVGSPASDLAFVANATTGVNAVLRSWPLQPGDEIVVTNHGYLACNQAASYMAKRAGAKVKVAHLPFPLALDEEEAKQQVIDAVEAVISDRTVLAIIDHITSPTGLVLPIEHIVASLEGRGVATLIDGAHGPGMRALNLSQLGASFYTGNLHKWVCAPKGAAFLYVRPDWQERIRPAVLSHGGASLAGHRNAFQRAFDWTGTDDPSPFFCLPTALSFFEQAVEGGWPAVMNRNRQLALWAREHLCEALGQRPLAPASMIGSLVAVLLEGAWANGRTDCVEDPLQVLLREKYELEVPIVPFPDFGARLLRVSAQLYNQPSDYQRLSDALKRCLQSGRQADTS